MHAATSPHRSLRVLATAFGCFLPASAPVHDPLTTSSSVLHDREDELHAAGDKAKRGPHPHLFETHIRLTAAANRDQAKAKLQQLAAAFAQFNGLATFRFRRRRCRRGFLLSHHELATLWHSPIASVQTPGMARTEYRRLEPPVNLLFRKRGEEQLTELGAITFQDRGDVFGLDARKYGLALTLAKQFGEQMEQGTAAAVFGNIGNLIAFQCGARDAEFLAEQFAGICLGRSQISCSASLIRGFKLSRQI